MKQAMGVWQEVAMDFLNIARARQGLPLYAVQAANTETALRPFQGWLPAEQAACGHSLPPWIPYAVRL